VKRQAQEAHFIPGVDTICEIQERFILDASVLPEANRADLFDDEEALSAVARIDEPDWLAQAPCDRL
jgi:hypothetical protein